LTTIAQISNVTDPKVRAAMEQLVLALAAANASSLVQNET